MHTLKTQIMLPPGMLSPQNLQSVMSTIFNEQHWFEPHKYGFSEPDEQTLISSGDLSGPLSLYEQLGALCISSVAASDYLWVLPVRQGDDYPCSGRLTWVTDIPPQQQPRWRASHATGIAKLMKLTCSPLAIVATDEDIRRKSRRMIDLGTHQQQGFTVRDYSEGLAGLFWRNFYGPPFVRLFGERLDTLPPECVTHLGEELVLVQPYELPTEAGSEAARAREQHLISLLGPECFYDHQHHRPPSRLPVLPPPPWPTPSP